MAKLNDDAIRAIIDEITADKYVELLWQLSDKGIDADDELMVNNMDSFDELFSGVTPHKLACMVSDGYDYDGNEFDAHAEYFRFDDRGHLQSLYTEDVTDNIVGGEAFDFLYSAIEDLSEADNLPELLAELAANVVDDDD